MNYILQINDEEKTLLLADLYEMAKQEDFYDKDVAERLYYKVLYAIGNGNDGNHISM